MKTNRFAIRALAAAALLLPAMAFAAADNTYANKAATAPASPYDSWAKAATEIRTAADETTTHGLVTVAAGDYSDDTKVMAPKQAVEMRIVNQPGGTAPGTITIKSSIFGDNVANTDPDKHRLTVSQGTMKGNEAVFLDGRSDAGTSYSGAAANFYLHLTGSDTYLDLTGKPFYAAYHSSGSTLHLSNGARMTAAQIYAGVDVQAAKNTKIIVDSGASVDVKGQTSLGASAGSGFVLIASNGCYKTVSMSVGREGFERKTSVIVAGSQDAALYINNGSLYLYNDSTLELNVAEAPLAGYASNKGLLYAAGISCNSNVTIRITGLQALADRVIAAEQQEFSTTLALSYSGNPIVLEGHALASLKESVAAVSGFKVQFNGPYLVLRYTAPKPMTTYAVPAGTAGNVPTDPYKSWTTAANEIRTAAEATGEHGLVMVAAGDYSGNAKCMTPRQAVEMRFVDRSGGSAPGTVSVSSPLFGFNVASTDPDEHALTVSLGTLTSPGSGGNFFSDGASDGGSSYSGVAANFRALFTGPETHLDLTGLAFYCGYHSSGTTLRIADGARLTSRTLYIGETSTGGRNTTVVVESGGVADITDSASGTTTLGHTCAGCSLIVSNATFKTRTMTVGSKGESRKACLTLAGSSPVAEYMYSLVTYGDSTVRFDMADAGLGGYDVAALQVPTLTLGEDSALEVVGSETLLRRMMDGGVGRIIFTLIDTNGGTLGITDAQLAAAQAKLPDYAELIVQNGKLLLDFGSKMGSLVIVR